jgi:hypothetical protein
MNENNMHIDLEDKWRLTSRAKIYVKIEKNPKQ